MNHSGIWVAKPASAVHAQRQAAPLALACPLVQAIYGAAGKANVFQTVVVCIAIGVVEEIGSLPACQFPNKEVEVDPATVYRRTKVAVAAVTPTMFGNLVSKAFIHKKQRHNVPVPVFSLSEKCDHGHLPRMQAYHIPFGPWATP
jgi:hypothetical protein